jgi:polysaccharide export outer membrane protein
MQAVLDDPRQNIYVQPGDVVTLVRDPQTFTAIGATGRNAVLPFETVNLTLDEALGKAGGLLDERADARGLFVVRYETPEVASQLPQASKAVAQAGGVPAIYHLDLRDSNALFLARRFPMRNKDIMYVSNAPLTEVQKVLTLVNLLLTPVITGITVQSVVK